MSANTDWYDLTSSSQVNRSHTSPTLPVWFVVAPLVWSLFFSQLTGFKCLKVCGFSEKALHRVSHFTLRHFIYSTGCVKCNVFTFCKHLCLFKINCTVQRLGCCLSSSSSSSKVLSTISKGASNTAGLNFQVESPLRSLSLSLSLLYTTINYVRSVKNVKDMSFKYTCFWFADCCCASHFTVHS